MSNFIIPRVSMFSAATPSYTKSIFGDDDMPLFDLTPTRRMRCDPFTDLMVSVDRGVVGSSNLSSNIYQDDAKYEVALDVPGIKPSDIKVQIENGGKVLHVSAVRKSRDEDQSRELKIDRRWALSDDIDVTQVKATTTDGVLVVTAPKIANEKKDDEVIPIEVVTLPIDESA
jgi:HSP20 family protein